MSCEIWLTLRLALGPASEKLPRLLEQFSTASRVLSASDAQLEKTLTKGERERLRKPNRKHIASILETCRKRNIRILTPEDAAYPRRLLQIADPPSVLFYRGTLPDVDHLGTVTIVGPREPTDYGKRAAFSLAYRLTRAGMLCISGGALGIDSYVHAGALAAGGQTLALLGCSIDYPYLVRNAALRRQIEQNGALLSEYPPTTPAYSGNFPVRNRLLSGLSLGVVVVEAGVKSGALHTARHANEQGRDVFVIPGERDDPAHEGSNALLEDGALALTGPADILEEYAARYPSFFQASPSYDWNREREEQKRAFAAAKKQLERGRESAAAKHKEPARTPPAERSGPILTPRLETRVGKTAQAVFAAIEGPQISPDELAGRLDIDQGRLLSAITELEMAGYLVAVPGGRYMVVK